MYKGIYLVFMRSLCIFVDILTVCYAFVHFKDEYNITLSLFFSHVGLFQVIGIVREHRV